MGELAIDIGQALRRVRRSEGLTLQAVAALSDGEFKATSVAGYERGERAITLERFCALCDLYGVSPERLLSEIMRSAGGRDELYVDLTALESLDSPEGNLVAGFIRRIVSLRGEPERTSIALRAGDLEVLATASERKRDELLALLRPVLSREG